MSKMNFLFIFKNSKSSLLIIIGILANLLIGTFSFAQTSVLAAAPGWNLLASEAKGDFDTLKLPIKRAGNLILVEAMVDSIRGNFILDTGAPGLVLNTTYFRDKAIRKNRSSVGIAGSTNMVYEMQVNKLQISTLYFEKIVVELTELSHIENNKNIKILGLLGNALFDDLEMEIDIRRNMLTLTKPNKNNSLRTKPDVLLPLSITNYSMFIPLKIAGKSINTCFDTGAEMMVLDNYLSEKILKNVQLSKRLNLTGTGGQKIEVWSGTLNDLQIGTTYLKNVPVLLSSLQQLSDAYGQPVDGILGFNLLEKGIVHISMRKKQFALYLYKENKNE